MGWKRLSLCGCGERYGVCTSTVSFLWIEIGILLSFSYEVKCKCLFNTAPLGSD